MKINRIKWKIITYLLAPFAFVYGVIIGIYGTEKGLTIDEIMNRYVYNTKLYKSIKSIKY